MAGKAGAPLTEAMFYVLMALRRGELCGTEIAAWTERCCFLHPAGAATPQPRLRRRAAGGADDRRQAHSGAGDAVYHLGAFSGGGLHSGDVGAGTAAELSVDGEGAASVPE